MSLFKKLEELSRHAGGVNPITRKPAGRSRLFSLNEEWPITPEESTNIPMSFNNGRAYLAAPSKMPQLRNIAPNLGDGNSQTVIPRFSKSPPLFRNDQQINNARPKLRPTIQPIDPKKRRPIVFSI